MLFVYEQELEHGEFVRVRIVHLNGKPKVLTLKQDLHYWPTWELKFDPETAICRRRMIKTLDCCNLWIRFFFSLLFSRISGTKRLGYFLDIACEQLSVWAEGWCWLAFYVWFGFIAIRCQQVSYKFDDNPVRPKHLFSRVQQIIYCMNI